MKEDTVVQFRHPASFEDPLTEVLRTGARQLLAQAVEMEVASFVETHADLRDATGRRRIVRHGYLPEREIQTGIGAVSVRCPRDRGGLGTKIRFTSAILPPYLRRSTVEELLPWLYLKGISTGDFSDALAALVGADAPGLSANTKSVEELLPWLYLKGISTGDFSDALAALVGADAPGLSANTIVRLKKVWQEELERWQGRDLSAKRYVYFWADGIYFQPRLDKDRQCILVIIGADDRGRKEVLAIDDGYRESAQSWRELLLDLKKRGLVIPPELATGDGALGFWKALREVYGSVREQRCWVHKTANVLNKLPKSVQPKVKKRLQDIWMAETKDEAEKAFDFFVEIFGPKYDKAVACLAKNRVELLTFYDFPAEHWKHLRTTNPIESTFATVRLRTARTKGCLSRKTALMMVFKLCQSASKKWRRLDGSQRLAEIIQGVTFKDGEKLTDRAA